jgi:Tol biopolymer transport system component
MLSFTILGSVLLIVVLLGCGPDSPFFISNPYRGSTPYDYKGENLLRLSQCGSFIWFPKWSPDGKSILYVKGGREKGLWIIDLEGGERTPRQIFSPSEAGIFFPHWSPDGQQILFTYSYGRGENVRNDIAIVNSDGSNFRILVKDAYEGCWLPDGERIIYGRGYGVGKDAEIERVFLYNLKTKEEKCLTPSGCKVLMICEVSPQGDKLLFAHDTEKKIPGLHFHIMDISTGEEYWLCAGQYASWSPDGKKIVYTHSTLSIVNVDGTPSTILEEKVPEVVEYLHFCYEPDWSPDGRKIAFTANKVIGQDLGRTSSELFILYLW